MLQNNIKEIYFDSQISSLKKSVNFFIYHPVGGISDIKYKFKYIFALFRCLKNKKNTK